MIQKKIWFSSFLGKQEEEKSPIVWKIKGGSLCSQIEKTTFIIGVFNRKENIYTCDSHCPFVKGLKARHCISGFYDYLFIFNFVDLVWGGHENVWKLVMIFNLN
jgi:hypothetical protein